MIAFAGELLAQAENLIKIGLHPSDIIRGYEKALLRATELLESNIAFEVKDPRDIKQVEIGLRASLSPKLGQYVDTLSRLVAEACIKALPTNIDNFDIEYIRVAKILGKVV